MSFGIGDSLAATNFCGSEPAGSSEAPPAFSRGAREVFDLVALKAEADFSCRQRVCGSRATSGFAFPVLTGLPKRGCLTLPPAPSVIKLRRLSNTPWLAVSSCGRFGLHSSTVWVCLPSHPSLDVAVLLAGDVQLPRLFQRS
ncbi:hypothetical protein U9M48_020660 [Paspalum notatum var. saurae]|uniref:Uncharacterized protein n=1 Tax=Paspalum notatum var. saurae TaxID=547442 RepID=A0AAQ3TFI9_PASNO